MLGKNDVRREGAFTTKIGLGKDSETARTFATRMFRPEGKNPYYKGETMIRNLDELDRNLNMFDASEAGWVADWLEYLGDPTTAARIRMTPAEFKRIVHERREELQRFV